jgi:probable rRNA maturation factor
MITIDPPSSPPTHKSTSASSSYALSKAGLSRFFNRARQAVGLTGEVEVLLTSDAELKRLNRSFRGKNKATDVLSFPAFIPEGFPAGFPIPDTAGDLAISLETAARQAAAFGHSLEDEVRILLLHGLLHLSGLDHETDNGEMAAREAELRDLLRLPNGLIARTEGPPSAPKSPRTAQAKSAAKTPASKSSAVKKTVKKATAKPATKATAAARSIAKAAKSAKTVKTSRTVKAAKAAAASAKRPRSRS